MAQRLPTFLIMGYGNSLRGDDGIGQQVAGEVEQWNLPQVTVKTLHQLTPELAEDLAQVDFAIFVDARLPESRPFPDLVQVERLTSTAEPSCILGHASSPQMLLSLSQTLYGQVPQSWLISVAGVNFELGEHLSPTATEGVKVALTQIQQLIQIHTP